MTWLVLASSENATYGYGTLSRGLCDALRKNGNLEIEVFSGEQKRWRFGVPWKLKSLGIGSRPRLWPFYVSFDFLCLLLTANRRYQGVLVLVDQYAAAAWIFSRLKGIPVVIVQCGTYAVRLPKDIPFFSHVAAKADRLIPISRYTHTRMLEEKIPGRYCVIPLGVDKEMFKPIPETDRRNEVLFVGNLKSRKGIDFLLDALAVAKQTVPDLRLVVVGKVKRESPEFKSLQEKIDKKKLDVQFSGFLDHSELVKAYSTTKLNALPSKSEPFYFEGFGLVHLEANACGALTVGAYESGNEDAIQPGCGFLVHYGDVQALSKVVIDVMVMSPYPKLALEKIRSWLDVASDYEQLLGDVIAEHQARRKSA